MTPSDVTVGAESVSAPALDAESAHWIGSLRALGPARQVALRGLHARLLRIARSELGRRNVSARIGGAELDDLAHQAAGDALLSIDAKLDGFRGESRFTTWAYKFVVFEVSNKIGRHYSRHPTAALDSEDWERLPDRFGLDPADRAEWGEMLSALRRAVDEDLTDRQRRVFVALVLNSIPLDALVLELDTNRNAIYKTMFDARRKLRAALVANGHLDTQA
jgi:RNA polymerase sigma-70 factor (ECF subfamily)